MSSTGQARVGRRILWAGLALSLSSVAVADVTVTGRVVNLSGSPMSQAMVLVHALFTRDKSYGAAVAGPKRNPYRGGRDGALSNVENPPG